MSETKRNSPTVGVATNSRQLVANGIGAITGPGPDLIARMLANEQSMPLTHSDFNAVAAGHNPSRPFAIPSCQPPG